MPFSSKVHREAELLNKQGYQIILIGHKNHPEVIGTMGQLPPGEVILIEKSEDINQINLSRDKIAYITKLLYQLMILKKLLKYFAKNPKIKAPIKSDICYATTNRQMAVKNVAKNVTFLLLVVDNPLIRSD